MLSGTVIVFLGLIVVTLYKMVVASWHVSSYYLCSHADNQ